MRRFVVALVLLILAICISVGSEVVFFRNTQALINSMTELLRVVDTGNREEVKEKLDTVMKKYESSQKVLHILLIHRSLDEIEININSLGEFLSADDMESFRQSCTEALRQLENLQGASKLTVENIF
ncbi:MAG: DUF4363 family protein [Clostridia bacterium]|nr:DUF4363 family protein [Clostridia bacterium]